MEIMQGENNTNGNFSNRLTDLISKCGHTQREISIQTSISPSALAKYKTDRIPKSEELLKLARYFDVTMEWLLTGRELSPAESTVLASNLYFGKEEPTKLDPESVRGIERLEETQNKDGSVNAARYLLAEQEEKAGMMHEDESAYNKLEARYKKKDRDLELENAVLKGQLKEARIALETVVSHLDPHQLKPNRAEVTSIDKAESNIENNLIELPFIGGVAAGSQISSDISMDSVQVETEYPDGSAVWKVYGDSMTCHGAKSIPDGSLIVCKPVTDRTPKKGSIVIYEDRTGSSLKEFGYVKANNEEELERADSFGNIPVLKSLNPMCDDVEVLDGGRITAEFVELL